MKWGFNGAKQVQNAFPSLLTFAALIITGGVDAVGTLRSIGSWTFAILLLGKGYQGEICSVEPGVDLGHSDRVSPLHILLARLINWVVGNEYLENWQD